MSISIIEALENGLHLFLSKIPSHLEIFKISEECYLGEYFEKSNFSNLQIYTNYYKILNFLL